MGSSRRRLAAFVVSVVGAVGCNAIFGLDDWERANVGPDASDAASEDGNAVDAVDAAPAEDAGDASRPTALAIGAVSSNGCVLLSDASVWCFGLNVVGGVGVSPPSSDGVPPTRVLGLPPAAVLASGSNFACVIAKGDASVWCWGRNTLGQLGHDPSTDLLCQTSDRCTPTPQKIPGLVAKYISAGLGVACAISTTNAVFCWGTDASAVLRGSSATTTGDSFTPVAIAGISSTAGQRMVEVSVSKAAPTVVCGVDETKKAWCWGSNSQGRLGHAQNTEGDVDCAGEPCNGVPKLVVTDVGTPLEDVAHVWAGRAMFLTKSDGTLWSWGNNTFGLLGLGSSDNGVHPHPTEVPGITNVKTVGTDEATCAGGADGLWCWGSGRNLKVTPAPVPCNVGGFMVGCAHSPTKMSSVPAIVQVDTAIDHVLALTPSGVALGWGGNRHGRAGHPFGTAGDDSNGDNGTPTPVVGLP
ncbi:MAG: hypothetical protein KF819_21420 [Labilithrix sp.]|nr:hypothetical protein [Labilithrix sp.]